MGYTTDFEGSLKISRPLTKKQTTYLNLLNSTRRMKRNVNKLMSLYNGKHGNPFPASKTPGDIYGYEGEYFAREDGNMGQNSDESIIDFNKAPGQIGWGGGHKYGQPGLWCGWCITEDGKFLEWDGGEKFYDYIEWLEYLIKHFFEPWGRKLNGEIYWYGEERSDMGKIIVKSNKIKVEAGEVEYR
jgi:hypothetical protein